MDYVYSLILNTLLQVWHTFSVNWPFLVISAVITAVLKLYIDQKKVAAFLHRNQSRGVVAATVAAVGTPLCSCGTTAVTLGMMAGLMPWAPVVAFMVASPLTSPQELFYSAGLFGWPFALTFFGASILLGLLGGGLAAFLEKQGWLENQARFKPIRGASGLPETMSIQPTPQLNWLAILKRDWRKLAVETWQSGKQLLVFFLGFAFIGYLLNGLIPQSWVAGMFGSGQTLGVPLAATVGLPLYFNTEASMPLVRALLDAGMSPGAALAFLITGAGTSVGAIAGALTIARWRVVGLVIVTLWIGAVVTGYLYNLALIIF